VTKGADAVRRLPTKDRLELFIKNGGFRGVVDGHNCVCVEVVKSCFVLGLEVRSSEATSRVSSR